MSAAEAPRPEGDGPSSRPGDHLHPGDVRILEQYLGHLRVERGLAENTLAAYRRDLRRYLADLSRRDADPASVDPQEVG